MGLFRRFLIKSYERDISRFFDFLKKMDDNQMGQFLAEAITIRVDLEAEGFLPTIVLDDGSISPHFHYLPFYCEQVQKAINQLKNRDKSPSTLIQVFALEVWLYSLYTLLKPELKEMGQQMWIELKRGMPHVRAELEKIIAKNKEVENGLLPGSRRRVFEILAHLPPRIGSQEIGKR
jgi:hypothetical protein